MKKNTLLITSISLFTLLLQGCLNSDKQTPTTYPTTVGTALSIAADEEDTMAPSIHALEKVSDNIGNILKTHITELNQEEAISFDKELNYCDISGEKESITSGNLEGITYKTKYISCKTVKTQQDGNIELTYSHTDSEGKYPQAVTLLVTEDYNFNDMVLKKELTVESTVSYNADKSLSDISLKVNGLVDFDYQSIILKDFEQEVSF